MKKQIIGLCLLTFVFLPGVIRSETSECYGTTSNGRLDRGVALPSSGANYEGYSQVARLAGRTFVHSSVRDIVVQSYKNLAQSDPTKVYKYAETGFKEGGEFSPHKTHRNGLSIDFMTPVKDEAGISVHLPTHPLNKFGYDIEFDKNSRYENLVIDYEAMASHIVALHKEAITQGFNLWRVIFDPELQSKLYKTKNGEYLKNNISFSKKRSWVRHDEHYHVDFIIPCKNI
ncbi:replication initiation protein [Gammaproteobacteria bacterium 45_16_T64]|nr:replication initiation protein [Gammaproteobacteria bacterium 45_16_T64]